MPGRLLAFVKASTSPSPSPKSSPKLVAQKPQTQLITLLPPYSIHPPPNNRTKSQDSIVMEALKRHSIGRLHSDKKNKVEPPKSATLDMVVESPPILFFNKPDVSTGAIFSGRLKINVTAAHATFEKLEMHLHAVVTAKKPVSTHCSECSSQKTEIHKWEFLTALVALQHGVHEYPFSHLLPGHLPATTRGSLGTVEYILNAVATTSTGEKITLKKDLDVRRAIFPGPDKNSIRVFPPTNLTAAVTLPPVIHPIGDFPIEMRLSGIVHNKDDSQTRWRLRKLNWRIEETQKFIAPACAKHANKIGGEGKGIQHEDVRMVGQEEVKHGWKHDFDQGNIDCEFRAAVNMAFKPLCDMESPNGMSVRHNLVVEMVVAEEWAPLKKLSQATPTGAARVLRTQFHLILTERAGLGISWDEEQPPMYEDVPASPPTYVGDYNVPFSPDSEHDAELRI